MFDHVGLRVRDLARSIAFYQAALRPLGHELCCQDGGSAGLGPKGAPALWLYATKEKAGASHLAFRAGTRAAVSGFHEAGLGAGGADNGKPGVRRDYAENYYAAFLIDPDGNNVEAVCMT
jgi:catechol 2,3-dioxygenase-like lactoylglutathione lyase family enzyme